MCLERNECTYANAPLPSSSDICSAAAHTLSAPSHCLMFAAKGSGRAGKVKTFSFFPQLFIFCRQNSSRGGIFHRAAERQRLQLIGTLLSVCSSAS